MSTVDSYQSIFQGWATQVEFVVDEPGGRLAYLGELAIPSTPQDSFLLAVASLPSDRIAPFLDCRIKLTTPQRQPWISSGIASEQEFAEADERLIIIKKPSVGAWKVSAEEGMIPYAVTVMAFHPAVVAPAPATGTSFKCRACKTTAKGLALAIVAAASFASYPAALIAAVSTFLGGVSTAVAAAFIASVIGDTVDVIAEKLCKRIRLCP